MGNLAVHDGGGVYLDGLESASIRDSVLSNNLAATGRGGGTFVSRVVEGVSIVDTAITDNEALQGGGGIYASDAEIVCVGDAGTSVREGIFANTVGVGSGRDVYIEDAREMIANTCDFYDEDTSTQGQVYLQATDTSHSFGDDASFTCSAALGGCQSI